MNWESFFSTSVDGIPLLFFVMAIVNYLGQLGLRGRGQLVGAMIVGLVFGMGQQIAQNGTPVGFGGWFACVVYGLALGLGASGVYETMKKTGNGIGGK